jgi:hypothetical protein
MEREKPGAVKDFEQAPIKQLAGWITDAHSVGSRGGENLRA